MRRFVLFAFVVAFSSGWTIPLYFSVKFLLDWCRFEAAPVIYREQGTLNSFPFLAESEKWWLIATSWLGLAVLFWSVVGAYRLACAWKSAQHLKPSARTVNDP